MAQTLRELTPYASLRHFFGAELRQWRLRAGLSHDRLGAQINFSGDLIGKVEKAERAPTVALAEACDEVLGTGGVLARLVGLIEALVQQEPVTRAAVVNAPERPACGWLLAGHAPTVGESSVRGADPVNRFEFLVSTFGAGAGSLLGSAESADASRLGHDDVVSWQRTLSRLYELDAQYGGGVVYDLALQSLRQLRRVLHRASYGPFIGEALRVVLGELSSGAGWLAFDGGRQLGVRPCCPTTGPGKRLGALDDFGHGWPGDQLGDQVEQVGGHRHTGLGGTGANSGVQVLRNVPDLQGPRHRHGFYLRAMHFSDTARPGGCAACYDGVTGTESDPDVTMRRSAAFRHGGLLVWRVLTVHHSAV